MNPRNLLGLLSHRYDNSIIRRTSLLVVFIVPAFLANLLVHYFATRMLSPQNFGIFYVAITLTNVLFSGSTLLHITYIRHLIQVGQELDRSVLVATMYRIQRSITFWGMIISFGLFLFLLLIGKSIGIRSTLLMVLIIADTYVSYLADLGRVYLQSIHRVVHLGFYTLLWMGIRLLLCVLGIYWLGTAWAALAGSTLAALIVYAGLQIYLAREKGAMILAVPSLPSLKTLGYVFFGFGFLTIISNLDIFLGYFVLGKKAAGVYSSSSVLHKGILVVITPLIQMLFGVMVAGYLSEKVFRKMVRKSYAVVFALTISGASFVGIFKPWMCGGRWGLHMCSAEILILLLISTIPLSLLKIAVVLNFVHKKDHLPLWLFVPVVAFAAIVWVTKPDGYHLATDFAFFSLGTLLFFLAIQRINTLFLLRRQGESVAIRTE